MKHVAARGRFVDERTVYLDNKLRHGRPGYEVNAPLRLDGTYVLVNRGWVPAGKSREVLPQIRRRAAKCAWKVSRWREFRTRWSWGRARPGRFARTSIFLRSRRKPGCRCNPS